MVRFLSEIFPASIAPSSERQFVVRAQREAVQVSDAQTDADGQTRARAKGGAAPSSSYSVALLASLSSFSFHSLRLSQLTHSHIQVMSLTDCTARSAAAAL